MEFKPENIDKINKSFDKQATKFESEDMNFVNEEYLKKCVSELELKKDNIVLEVAAGTCACGRSIAPHVKSVTCLDATPSMLAIGKEQAEKQNIDNIKFLTGYIEDIPYSDNTFDVVICRHAFHHFTNVDAPFKEMERVLKPGGKLVIIDMELTDKELRKVRDKIESIRDDSHVMTLTRKDIENLYDNNNVKIIKESCSKVCVSVDAWLALTETTDQNCSRIMSLFENEVNDEIKTDLSPFYKNDKLHFYQNWIMVIGIK